MVQIASTFRDRALTYEEAQGQHETVVTAIQEFTRGNQQREQYCEQLWMSLVDLLPEEDKGAIADCVDVTIPAEFIPLMRRIDSIMATFAFDLILGEIVNSPDFEDDLALRPLFKEAWRKFNKRRLEANQVEEGFGCDQSASWHTLRDIHNVDDSEGDWKKRILEIAKLAGKMFDQFSYTPKKVKSDDPMEVEGVTTGKDLERLLPHELALMSDEKFTDMQTMKVLKGDAQQRKMKGVRTTGRGPMVLLIDESGSMHDFGGYWGGSGKRGRNTWAKACAIALTRVAWSEGREVRAVHFGHGAVCQDLPRDDMHALFEMARSFMSGGTSFTLAMEAGMREVDDLDKKGFKGADIVLLTDGEEHNYNPHNRMLDKMDATGIDLWTVAIGQPFGLDAPTRKRAKKYVEAQDSMLGDDATATELTDGLQEAAMDNDENDPNFN